MTPLLRRLAAFACSTASRDLPARWRPMVVLAAGLTGLLGGLPAISHGQAAAADTPPVVTILEGPAQALRGASRRLLVEGVRLAPQDIVHTLNDGRLVRIEFADGLAASLGPGSAVWIAPRFDGRSAGGRGRSARLYLLQGWLKLDAPRGGNPQPGSTGLVASPAVDLTAASGSVVMQVQDQQLQVFAESGEVRLQERLNDAAAGGPQALRSGAFLARGSDGKLAQSPRPAPGFVQQLPRGFLDTLPARAASFKDRRPEPKEEGPITYTDAQPWLSAEGSLRRPALPRWQPLTRNPAFRNALVANMAAHPEWDRLLFPEKYRPKPASPAPAASSARPLR